MHQPTLGAEGVMDTFSQLLKAHTDVMMAQVKAAAVQSLPSLSHYSGEGSDITDNEFDRWVERFHERAKFAHWTEEEEEQLYQLKLHLDKSVLDVLRMLPGDEHKTVESTLEALRKLFRPADIEEIRATFITVCKVTVRRLSNLVPEFNNWDARLSLLFLEKASIDYSRVDSIRPSWSFGSGGCVALSLKKDSTIF